MMLERDKDEAYNAFIKQHESDVLGLFDILAQDTNYFAKREGLKSLYQLLCRHVNLRNLYTESKERLKFIMNTVLD